MNTTKQYIAKTTTNIIDLNTELSSTLTRLHEIVSKTQDKLNEISRYSHAPESMADTIGSSPTIPTILESLTDKLEWLKNITNKSESNLLHLIEITTNEA